jgi:hypothetical protein
MTTPAYRIARCSAGEYAEVLDLGVVDLHPELLVLWPVFLVGERPVNEPTLAWYVRRKAACMDEAALRQANGKRDAWNGSRALREAMAV